MTVLEVTTLWDFATDVVEILLIGWLYWYVLWRKPKEPNS